MSDSSLGFHHMGQIIERVAGKQNPSMTTITLCCKGAPWPLQDYVRSGIKLAVARDEGRQREEAKE